MWESGETKSLDAAYLFSAARMLGVSPEWLATGNGSKFPTATQSSLPDITLSSPEARRKKLLEIFDALPTRTQLFLLGFLENIAVGKLR